MASVTQIKRLLGLLDHLQSDEAHNARQLAEKVGVSRRTLFRDLRALEKLGFEVRYDERAGRYVVEGDREALAGGTDGGTDQLKTLMDLGQRLESSPNDFNDRIAELPSLIELRASHDGASNEGEVFGAIVQSLCLRRKLRIMRTAGGDSSQVQSVTPLRLTFSQAAWHMIGDVDGVGPVAVPIREILRADVTDEAFKMPPAAEIEAVTDAAFSDANDDDSLDEVVVRFSSQVARDVAERRWFRSQELEWLDDGSLELRTNGGHAARVLQWVLSFGADASVVKPEMLRTRVADHVSQMAEKYRTSV